MLLVCLKVFLFCILIISFCCADNTTYSENCYSSVASPDTTDAAKARTTFFIIMPRIIHRQAGMTYVYRTGTVMNNVAWIRCTGHFFAQATL